LDFNKLIQFPPDVFHLTGMVSLPLDNRSDESEVCVEQGLNDIRPSPIEYQDQDAHWQPESFGHPIKKLSAWIYRGLMITLCGVSCGCDGGHDGPTQMGADALFLDT
jgi:hypothetical protein